MRRWPTSHARTFNAFPRVSVETIAFEEWAGEPKSFDLVFCAQAWHWLSPTTRYEETSRLLRANGTLAVFANWDADVLEEVQPAYQRHGLVESGCAWAWQDDFPPDMDGGVAAARASIERSGAYEEVEFHRYPWSRSFEAHEYVALLRTISDISTRAASVREPFLADVARAIDDAGGVVTRHYEAAHARAAEVVSPCKLPRDDIAICKSHLNTCANRGATRRHGACPSRSA